MQTYIRKTGQWLDTRGNILGVGWAGQGIGKNNPDMDGVHNIGPLPAGLYTITAPYDNPKTGPYTMNLEPDPSNNMKGRADFRIHGAAFTNPELSSEGCIIQVRGVRQAIWDSDDHQLQVQ
jgi:Protein of unknown function (DUF2778)